MNLLCFSHPRLWLIVVALSVTMIMACSEKDSAPNDKTDTLVAVDTPVKMSSDLSAPPSPVANEVLKDTPVPKTTLSSNNPSINVPAFLDLMDAALAEGYSYQTQVDIEVNASLGDQRQKFLVLLEGVSDGNDYDASLTIDEVVPMDIRHVENRTFSREPDVADIWRELPEGQDVINAPEIITSARAFVKEAEMLGREMMGGLDTHHMSALLDGNSVGSFIGVLVGTEGDLKSDFWIEAETGRVVRLTVTGQTSGKDNPDLLIDVDLTLSTWDFGKQVDILIPVLPPSPGTQQWDAQPGMTLDVTKDYRAIIKLYKKGEIFVDLYEKLSPVTVNNFVFLSENGFYDGVTFHRVIPDFMAQTGDPTGTGSGGPGYKFQNEFHPDARHDGAGILSMANSGLRNGQATNGSQFFITYKDTSFLDGLNADTSPKDCSAQGASCHSVFGRVTSGMDVVEAIHPRDPAVGGYADIIESIAIIIE